MKAELRGEKGIWTWAIAGAVAALLIAMVLFRFPTAIVLPPRPAMSASSAVSFRPLNAADTSISLLDPIPLFLPTQWNAHATTLPADAVRERGSTFGSYEAWFHFQEDAANLTFPRIVAVPEKAVDAIEVGPALAAFAGIGEGEVQIRPLEPRDAFIAIVAEKSGGTVLQETVRGAHLPGEANWQPLEFLAVVQAAGLVAQPTLIGSGSGFETVDAFFQNYLAKVLRVGERLPPGIYRIKIGP